MDLIYGHLGTPIYDIKSKSWHFSRNPQSNRFFHPIGRLFKDTTTERHASSNVGTQQQLLNAYPELGGSLFSEDAHFSEIVSSFTSQYDPTVSDLLAVGHVVDATHPRALKETRYKQIIAIASGAAGELVKFIILNQQHLKWSNRGTFKLETLTVKNGEEGWWRGNGSPIQQVVFAGNERQSSTWLAVRYQGAISILKPTLQLETMCPNNVEGQIHDLPASRLDANHIITLTSQDVSGIPFADVTFNPWDPQQFATIDQRCHWHLWGVKRQIKSHGLWALEKLSSGSFANNEELDHDSSQLILDGWAKALWVSDADTVFIASRRKFAIFDVRGEPTSLGVPDLGLKKSPDWILDVKRSPVSTNHLLVVTSSRLFLLETRPSGQRGKLLAAAAILVSWVHFRSPEDVSLSMSFLDSGEHEELSHRDDTTAVVVYSRLNSLTSVFTFEHSNVHGHAISKCDPCLLPIFENVTLSPKSQLVCNDKPSLNGLLCLHVTPVTMVHARAFNHHNVSEEQDRFFLLRVLYRDKSLSEHLYVESALKIQSLQPPDIQTLDGRKKTPARVIDDFLVSDGVGEESEISKFTGLGATPLSSGLELSKQRKINLLGSDAPFDHLDTRTIEMCWLVGLINERERTLRSQPFESCLESAQDAINTKLGSTTSGAETLLELSKAGPLVTDIDIGATALSNFLQEIPHSPPTATKAAEISPETRAIVSTSLPQTIGVALGFKPELHLSQVYDSLIRSQIGPLPPKTPSRVRIAIEKQLRSLAAQLCLAAYAVRICVEAPAPNGPSENDPSTQDSTFAMPVRRKGPKIPLSNAGREAVMQSSPTQPLAPLSGPSGFQAVSKRGFQSSIGSKSAMHVSIENTPSQSAAFEPNATEQAFSEDPSSINLRPLVSLAPQPLLPAKLSNILSHWNIGEDPASYDWEAAQRATVLPDSAAIAAEQARKEKAAKKAKKLARFSTLLGSGETPHGRAAEGAVYSQPEPQRVVESKSQGMSVTRSQIPESSQSMGAAVSSQPLAGRFAGGQKGSKAKKGRKSGF